MLAALYCFVLLVIIYRAADHDDWRKFFGNERRE